MERAKKINRWIKLDRYAPLTVEVKGIGHLTITVIEKKLIFNMNYRSNPSLEDVVLVEDLIKTIQTEYEK